MCLCCVCLRGPDKYYIPRYKYRYVSCKDIWIPISLIAVIVGVHTVMPFFVDYSWGTAFPVRAPSLETRFMKVISTLVMSSSDIFSGVGSDAFDRSSVAFNAPQKVDEEANLIAKALAEQRLNSAYKRAELLEDEEKLHESVTDELEDRSLLYVYEDNDSIVTDFPVSVRIFTPLNPCTPQVPVVVYFHGGGFVLNSAKSSMTKFMAERVMEETGAIVVAVEYRLAPEDPFPAAVEDSETALQWVFSGALGPTANLSHVVLFGDEAGGNLAAVTAMLRRDRIQTHSEPRLAPKVSGDDGTSSVHSIVCVYPWFFREGTASRLRFKDFEMLTDEKLNWFEKQYRKERKVELGKEDLLDPLLSERGMNGMPETHVFTCGVCFCCSSFM